MCEHPYLIYRIVNDTDVRLSDRYRRPLGLDHKFAQRVEICQYTRLLPIYITHTMISDMEDVLDSSQSGVPVLPVRHFKLFRLAPQHP
jgi:hypothetical protein